MDAGNSSDVHEVSSENELYPQRYDMDQCVPFDGDSVSNESDVEDWLQLDPGNLDDILGTEDLEPLSTCPSLPRNPSPFTYESETYSMEYETVESEYQGSSDDTVLPKMQILIKRSKQQSWHDMENDYYRVIPSHAMPLANGSFDCTSHEGFFSATTQPKELVSVGVQTDPMRKKRVVWKSTRYQEDQKEIEIVEVDEMEYV